MPINALTCHHKGCNNRASDYSSSCGQHGERTSANTKTLTCVECGCDFEAAARARTITCSQRCKGARRISKQREWMANNPERFKATYTARYDRKREDILAYQANLRLTRADEIRVSKRHYRSARNARVALTRKTVRQKDLARCLARYRNECAYCGASGRKLHWDHVIPISRGGATSIGNLLPACDACNLSKGPKTVMEWRLRTKRAAA